MGGIIVVASRPTSTLVMLLDYWWCYSLVFERTFDGYVRAPIEFPSFSAMQTANRVKYEIVERPCALYFSLVRNVSPIEASIVGVVDRCDRRKAETDGLHQVP